MSVLETSISSAYGTDAEPVAVDASQVVAGSPTTISNPFGRVSGPVEIGVWSISEGTVTDVEVNETSVILSGRARITVNGAAEQIISAGSIVTFQAGDVTTWVIEQTIRKFYVYSFATVSE